MPAFPRTELEEMMRRWVAANDRAGETGDWSPLADYYTEDALYTWNFGAKHEFVARGREQIRDWALGTEMSGLERWVYPYVRVLIDDQLGEVVGIWRQVAPLRRSDGTSYEIAGTGGSWFRYAGGYRWSWQRDFFDHANAGVIFQELARDGKLTAVMQDRLRKGSRMPGWTPICDFDWYATLADDDQS